MKKPNRSTKIVFLVLVALLCVLLVTLYFVQKHRHEFPDENKEIVVGEPLNLSQEEYAAAVKAYLPRVPECYPELEAYEAAKMEYIKQVLPRYFYSGSVAEGEQVGDAIRITQGYHAYSPWSVDEDAETRFVFEGTDLVGVLSTTYSYDKDCFYSSFTFQDDGSIAEIILSQTPFALAGTELGSFLVTQTSVTKMSGSISGLPMGEEVPIDEIPLDSTDYPYAPVHGQFPLQEAELTTLDLSDGQ